MSVGGEQVSLRVVHHLHPVLDRSQESVGAGQLTRLPLLQSAGLEKGADRVKCRGRPHGRIAAALDHLLDLDEELDFSDSAAAALQVIAWADVCALGEMVANSRGDLPDLFYHSEIQRAAPHKGLDRVEKALTERDITGRGAGPDESRTFPW